MKLPHCDIINHPLSRFQPGPCMRSMSWLVKLLGRASPASMTRTYPAGRPTTDRTQARAVPLRRPTTNGTSPNGGRENAKLAKTVPTPHHQQWTINSLDLWIVCVTRSNRARGVVAKHSSVITRLSLKEFKWRTGTILSGFAFCTGSDHSPRSSRTKATALASRGEGMAEQGVQMQTPLSRL